MNKVVEHLAGKEADQSRREGFVSARRYINFDPDSPRREVQVVVVAVEGDGLAAHGAEGVPNVEAGLAGVAGHRQLELLVLAGDREGAVVGALERPVSVQHLDPHRVGFPQRQTGGKTETVGGIR